MTTQLCVVDGPRLSRVGGGGAGTRSSAGDRRNPKRAGQGRPARGSECSWAGESLTGRPAQPERTPQVKAGAGRQDSGVVRPLRRIVEAALGPRWHESEGMGRVWSRTYAGLDSRIHRWNRFDRSPCAAVAIVPRRAAETPMLLRRPGIELSPVGCRSRTVGRSTPRRRPPHLPTSLLHRERRLRLRAHSASRRRWGRTGSGRTPPPTHLQLASRCSVRGRPHAVQRAQ